jgi:hypothetical protein
VPLRERRIGPISMIVVRSCRSRTLRHSGAKFLRRNLRRTLGSAAAGGKPSGGSGVSRPAAASAPDGLRQRRLDFSARESICVDQILELMTLVRRLSTPSAVYAVTAKYQVPDGRFVTV